MKQLSLWDEESRKDEPIYYVKLIYFDGRRKVVAIGSPEWEETEGDMNIWSAQFVDSDEDC